MIGPQVFLKVVDLLSGRWRDRLNTADCRSMQAE